MIISLAPLQGYTEFAFRNALHTNIGGVQRFYTPYLKFENDGTLREKYLRDILPVNNQKIPLVPQILVNNANQFIQLATLISDYGYPELNWNLGCPYPMVANRKLGSGLLAYPTLINEILTNVLPKTNLKISVKMRLGYANEMEIYAVLETLNQFNISEIVVHPRIGKQLYKGSANIEAFSKLANYSKHPLAFNGDITTCKQIEQLQERFSDLTHVMIGRGLLSNPFLGLQLSGQKLTEKEIRTLFQAFYEDIYHQFEKNLSGEAHLLNRMQVLWEYFSQLFENDRKIFKMIKKSSKLSQYNSIIDMVIKNYPLKNL